MKALALRFAAPLLAGLLLAAPAAVRAAAPTPAEKAAVQDVVARVSSLVADNVARIRATGTATPAQRTAAAALMQEMQGKFKAIDVSRCPADFRAAFAALLGTNDRAVELGRKAIALESLPKEQAMAQGMMLMGQLKAVQTEAVDAQVRFLRSAKACGADVSALSSGPWAEAAVRLGSESRPDPSSTRSPGTQRLVNRQADLEDALTQAAEAAGDDLEGRYAALRDFYVQMRRIDPSDSPAAVRAAYTEYRESIRKFGAALKALVDARAAGKDPGDAAQAPLLDAVSAAEQAVTTASQAFIDAARAAGADPSPLETLL